MQNLPKLPNQKTTEQENWQTRTYVTGITLGALMGFLSAYMFNRAAEESEDGQPPTISTATLMGLALSIISLLRQVSESGKPRKK